MRVGAVNGRYTGAANSGQLFPIHKSHESIEHDFGQIARERRQLSPLTTTTTKETQVNTPIRNFRIVSIGVNDVGNSVIRVEPVDGHITERFEVATNVIGFAKLAGAGVLVVNSSKANPGKV